jgi:hypothetical protein
LAYTRDSASSHDQDLGNETHDNYGHLTIRNQRVLRSRKSGAIQPNKTSVYFFRKIDLDFLLPRVKLIRQTYRIAKELAARNKRIARVGKRAEAEVTLVF